MTYRAVCAEPGCKWPGAVAEDMVAALRAFHAHADTHIPHDIIQLPSVTFREAALTAIRAAARTGRPFTIGELHDRIPIAPLNPRTEWASVTREAAADGWIEHCGYTESVVPTTRASAVKQWRGTAKAASSAA